MPDNDLDVFASLKETADNYVLDVTFDTPTVLQQMDSEADSALINSGGVLDDEVVESLGVPNYLIEAARGMAGLASGVQDIAKGVVGGARDAVENTKNTALDVAGAVLPPPFSTLGKATPQALETKGTIQKIKKDTEIPKVEPQQTFLGSASRVLTQFALPFSALGKAGVTGNITREGLATFMGFEGMDANLSALLENELGVDNPVSRWLADKDPDNEMTNKAKNTIEAIGVAGGMGLVSLAWKGAKTLKAWKQTKLAREAATEVVFKTNEELKELTKEITEKGSKKTAKTIIEKPPLLDELDSAFSKEEVVSVSAQKQLADALNISEEDILAGDIIPKIERTSTRDAINRASILQAKAFDMTKETVLGLSEGLELGDAEIIDQIMGTVVNYAEFQSKVVSNMSDYARSIGFRGHLPQVKATNVLKKAIPLLAKKDKEDFAKGVVNLMAVSDNPKAMSRFLGELEKTERVLTPKQALEEPVGERVSNFLKSANEKLRTAYVNSKLASSITLTTDVVGKVGWSAVLVLEKGAKDTSKMLRHKLATGDFTPDYSETRALISGMQQSISSGFAYISSSLMGRTRRQRSFKQLTGVSLNPIRDLAREFKKARVSSRNRFDLPTDLKGNFSLLPEDLGKNLGGSFGKFVSQAAYIADSGWTLPSRFMSSTDDVMKSILYRGEVEAGIVRQLDAEKLIGEERVLRAKELQEIIGRSKKLSDIKFTDSEIVKMLSSLELKDRAIASGIVQDAVRFAKEGTFTYTLSERSESMIKFMNTYLWPIAPFVRTPVLLVDQTIQRTPLINLLTKRGINDLKAGGARLDALVARSAVGSMAMVSGLVSGFTGNLIGPIFGTRSEVKMQKAAGVIPNSIVVGKGRETDFFDITRYDPISTIVLAPVTVMAAIDELDNVLTPEEEKGFSDYLTGVGFALSDLLASKTFLQSFSQLMAALSNSRENAREVTRFFETSLADLLSYPPTKILLRDSQEHLQEVQSFYDAFLRNYGFGTVDKRGILGQKIGHKETLLKYGVPSVYSQASKEPVLYEAAKQKANLTKPSRIVDKVPMDWKVYNDSYLSFFESFRISGKTVKEGLEKLYASETYKNAPSVEQGRVSSRGRYSKNQLIEKWYNFYKKSAKEAWFGQNLPEVLEFKEKINEHRALLQNTPVQNKQFNRILGEMPEAQPTPTFRP